VWFMLDSIRRPWVVLLTVILVGSATAGCASSAPRSRALPTITVAVPTATVAVPTATVAVPTATVVVPTITVAEPTATAAPTPAASEPVTSAPAQTPRPGPTAKPEPGDPAPPILDLVTPDGAPFDLANLRGHPALVFFGYTHCPDVCPETVGQLVQVLDHRPDARVVFVTVDPERDTEAWLADYLEYLPDGMTAVTGSPTAIKAAADAYGAHYARVDTGSASGYSMSHTAFLYLIDSEGRHVLTYPFGVAWGTIVDDLDRLAQ
jgi:protein SCO1